MKATPQVVDVEQETTTTAPRSLPALRAPKVQILGDWHDVKDYLIDNLLKSHLYYYDYKEASRTVGTYYSTFNELRLSIATTGESESEEELQSMRAQRRTTQHMEVYNIEGRPTFASFRASTTSSQLRPLFGFELKVYYSGSAQRAVASCGVEPLHGGCTTEELASLLQARWFYTLGVREPQ